MRTLAYQGGDLAARRRGGTDAAPSDALLVARARRGDTAAFELLAGRHVKVVLALLRQNLADAHAAEDAAQDALLIAYRKMDTLDDPARFGAWLYRIALRSRPARDRQWQRVASGAPAEHADRDTRLDEAAEGAERKAAVRAAVAGLDEPYRLVVTLHYLQDLSAQEIAAALDVPDGTIRAQLSRAREMLREKLRRVL